MLAVLCHRSTCSVLYHPTSTMTDMTLRVVRSPSLRLRPQRTQLQPLCGSPPRRTHSRM